MLIIAALYAVLIWLIFSKLKLVRSPAWRNVHYRRDPDKSWHRLLNQPSPACVRRQSVLDQRLDIDASYRAAMKGQRESAKLTHVAFPAPLSAKAIDIGQSEGAVIK
jgi:hypothetical protein